MFVLCSRSCSLFWVIFVVDVFLFFHFGCSVFSCSLSGGNWHRSSCHSCALSSLTVQLSVPPIIVLYDRHICPVPYRYLPNRLKNVPSFPYVPPPFGKCGFAWLKGFPRKTNIFFRFPTSGPCGKITHLRLSTHPGKYWLIGAPWV